MSGWKKVRLGEVLRRSMNIAPLDPQIDYREITVRLWGKGVVERVRTPGVELAGSRRFVARPGQLILSRIDARNGALGLIPSSLDGAVVSNDFPLFDLDLERALPEFLSWLSKTASFVDLCRKASEGTTNRVRLQEERFLVVEILLPPLAEQRQVVALIEEVAGRVREAQDLRRRATLEALSLCRALIASDSNAKLTPMADLVHLRSTDIAVEPNQTYNFAGVYSFGRGVFRGQTRMGLEFAYKRLTRLRVNDFVFPKLMAWEGAFGVVPEECHGCVVSPEFPVFEVVRERVLPEVIDVFFRDPTVWPELAGSSTGTNVRRRRLNPREFLRYRMPLPNRDMQEVLRDVHTKVCEVQRLQAEATAELDALLAAVLEQAFRGPAS